ncbi:MAG TPA: CDP-alcohol phosphatidyltransferase family protein [Blastocatellia bacterium]|nr:CDP-alcohol phosphatidyltransferase family protein [Blastocatellia bacterium]
MISPNLITLVRIFMAFGSVALFRAQAELRPYAGLAALLLLILALALDAVDGYVARRFGLTSDVGAAFDIAADRIIESVFWIYFSSVGLISFWIPVIVVARGGFTDFLRAIAFARGRTAFGEKTMMRTWWGRLLVGSRASRTAYGLLKCAAFSALGLWLVLADAPEWQARLAAGLLDVVRIGALALAVASVTCCLVRGVPVIIEGLRFFRKDLVLPKVW